MGGLDPSTLPTLLLGLSNMQALLTFQEKLPFLNERKSSKEDILVDGIFSAAFIYSRNVSFLPRVLFALRDTWNQI